MTGAKRLEDYKTTHYSHVLIWLRIGGPRVIDEDRHARTWAVLQSLPARLRRILVLREVEGLPMGEAARRLGLSRAVAERRWMRAIVLMTERLEKAET